LYAAAAQSILIENCQSIFHSAFGS